MSLFLFVVKGFLCFLAYLACGTAITAFLSRLYKWDRDGVWLPLLACFLWPAFLVGWILIQIVSFGFWAAIELPMNAVDKAFDYYEKRAKPTQTE